MCLMNPHKSKCVSHAYVLKGWILAKQGSKNTGRSQWKTDPGFSEPYDSQKCTVVRYQEM